MPSLFSPLQVGPVELVNRLAVAPMCQYSAEDGCASLDWHLPHLGGLAQSGAGLRVLEATAVERRGRITHGDLGLWSNDNEAALARVLAAVRRHAPPGLALGIQLAHAGRKASTRRPWEGDGPLDEAGDAWPVVAPSALPFADGWPTPRALDAAGLARVRDAFVASARRAVRLGFEAIELHCAHGYLLHEFQSPLSNHRDDGYGGSRDARERFPVEVARAVRAVVPAHVALGARITGSDWVDGGLGPDDAAHFAQALKDAGLDYLDVSSGGVVPKVRIPSAPGYQVPFATRVRAATGLPTRAVGLITGAAQAEAIIASGAADWVALGRGFLDDPRFGWHAAATLGASVPYAPQYERVQPKLWAVAAARAAR